MPIDDDMRSHDWRLTGPVHRQRLDGIADDGDDSGHINGALRQDEVDDG